MKELFKAMYQRQEEKGTITIDTKQVQQAAAGIIDELQQAIEKEFWAAQNKILEQGEGQKPPAFSFCLALLEKPRYKAVVCSSTPARRSKTILADVLDACISP